MPATATAEIVTGIHLNDAALFREQCYVDGNWVDADTRAAFDVTDPATGQSIGTVPAFGRTLRLGVRSRPPTRRTLRGARSRRRNALACSAAGTRRCSSTRRTSRSS